MPDSLKRSVALIAVFSLAFGTVYLLRSWQQGRQGDLGGGGAEQRMQETATLAEKGILARSEVPGLSALNDELTQLVRQVRPSVVSIDRDLLSAGVGINPLTRKRLSDASRLPHLGSGVIVSTEGHVLTNHHVIAGTERLRVIMSDGRSLPARLIASDPLHDIAVIRLQPEKAESFQPLKFADSDRVEVGQLAIVVGNPFGLGESVTVGYISARDRSYSDQDRDMFQTDAAINPGNSGGPMLNHLGEIIGINAAIITRDVNNPSFQGIGLSIPSNDARRSFEHILEKGRPVYGYLGLQLAPLNDYSRSVLSYSGEGVVVLDVFPGSPADAAGIRPMDIISSYAGEGVVSPNGLITKIRGTNVGSQVSIALQQGSRVKVVQAEVHEEASAATAGESGLEGQLSLQNRMKDAVLPRIGLEVEALPAYLYQEGRIGLRVVGVVPDSLAETLGIPPGCIVTHLDGSPLRNAQDFYLRMLARAPRGDTVIQVLQGQERREVTFPQVVVD